MLTAEKLVDHFISGDDDFGILCHDSVQRQEVIKWLIDHGVSHGSSGESEKMLEDEFYAEDKWMFVVSDCEGIEFYTTSYEYHDVVKYEEFARLVGLANTSCFTVQVDDLL